MNSPAASPGSVRNLALDGVRGLAISLVLVWHYFTCEVVVEPGSLLAYAKWATGLTWSGVDLFFVLSGFLIGGIILDTQKAANFYTVFYVRRATRIVPIYFIVIFAYVLLSMTSAHKIEWLFADPIPLGYYLTFSQNMAMGMMSSFGSHWLAISWSLGIEEQFYILLPLLMRNASTRYLTQMLVFMFFLAPIFRGSTTGLGAYVYLWCRIDSLLAGVIVACLIRDELLVANVRARIASVWAVFLSAGACIVGYRILLHGVVEYVYFSLLAMFYATLLLILLIQRHTLLYWIFTRPALIWLGLRSYSIYLIHQPISGLWFGAVFGTEPKFSDYRGFGITIISLISTLLLANLSYYCVESHFLRFGHRLRYATLTEAGARTSHQVRQWRHDEFE